MKYIGAHVADETDFTQAPLVAREIGARSFAINVVNMKTWRHPPLTDAEVREFKENCVLCGFPPELILPHARLLINAGSPDRRKLALSRIALDDEIIRCGRLGLKMINFHPGAHLNRLSEEECLDTVAESVNYCINKTADTDGAGVTLVIENTAGPGTVIGWSFAQIGRIISGVDDKSRVGVCIDSCHAFGAGYDLSTPEGYDRCWDEFDREIGASYLRAMHINDSLKPLGSRLDRHAVAGQGLIGQYFYRRMMTDPRFDNMPLILETPSPGNWQREIAWIYSLSDGIRDGIL